MDICHRRKYSFETTTFNQLNDFHMSTETKFNIIGANGKLMEGNSTRLPLSHEMINT